MPSGQIQLLRPIEFLAAEQKVVCHILFSFLLSFSMPHSDLKQARPICSFLGLYLFLLNLTVPYGIKLTDFLNRDNTLNGGPRMGFV